MIQYEHLHHVSIVVRDLERAKQFYGEKLGLTEIERPDLGFPGAWYAIGNQQIHLLVYNESKTLRNSDRIDTKDGHYAFRIKNYWETVDYLKSQGIQVETRPESKTGFAQIYCVDPDGNVIEFNMDQQDL